jgi:RimJ/RimL family protein N-acetyltransferase
MEIASETIRLRPLEKGDMALKVKWFNDPEVNKTLVVTEKFELEKSIQWFKKVANDPSRRDFIIETRQLEPIGVIGLVHIDKVHNTAEIYIVIGQKDYWGKGVMLEAESLLIDWAFKELGLYKISAPALPANVASIITMKKLGFQIEGTLREDKFLDGKRVDIIQLGLLRDEFRSSL